MKRDLGNFYKSHVNNIWKQNSIFIIEEILHATLINVNKLDNDCDKDINT